jgi:hypothetical protein
VGHDWVLDYKSDRTIQPEDHRFQLWVYAAALNHPQAHIVYLRHDKIHTFTKSHLEEIASEAHGLAQNISQGNYIATPTMEKCAYCPYLAFCNDATIQCEVLKYLPQMEDRDLGIWGIIDKLPLYSLTPYFPKPFTLRNASYLN